MREDDEKYYDVRLVERNIQEGVYSKKDVEKHFKGLEDLSDKAEWFSYDFTQPNKDQEQKEAGS